MDYSLRDRNVSKHSRAYDSLAQLHYSEGEHDADPYSIQLRRDRDRRGYGLAAPIYDSGDGVHTQFGVSRTKEYKWFSGLQLSFAF